MNDVLVKVWHRLWPILVAYAVIAAVAVIISLSFAFVLQHLANHGEHLFGMTAGRHRFDSWNIGIIASSFLNIVGWTFLVLLSGPVEYFAERELRKLPRPEKDDSKYNFESIARIFLKFFKQLAFYTRAASLPPIFLSFYLIIIIFEIGFDLGPWHWAVHFFNKPPGNNIHTEVLLYLGFETLNTLSVEGLSLLGLHNELETPTIIEVFRERLWLSLLFFIGLWAYKLFVALAWLSTLIDGWRGSQRDKQDEQLEEQERQKADMEKAAKEKSDATPAPTLEPEPDPVV